VKNFPRILPSTVTLGLTTKNNPTGVLPFHTSRPTNHDPEACGGFLTLPNT
jgi:hypothetical protein